MTTEDVDGGPAEDWLCNHARVASGVRLHEGSGREGYTVPPRGGTQVTTGASVPPRLPIASSLAGGDAHGGVDAAPAVPTEEHGRDLASGAGGAAHDEAVRGQTAVEASPAEALMPRSPDRSTHHPRRLLPMAVDDRLAHFDEHAPSLGPHRTLTALRHIHPVTNRQVAQRHLIAARAFRWLSDESSASLHVTCALAAATLTDDGRLLAQVWLARATLLGGEASARGIAAAPLVSNLCSAAASRAGTDHPLHASALFRLSFERAASRDAWGARRALDEAQRWAARGDVAAAVVGAHTATTLWALGDCGEAERCAAVGCGAQPSLQIASLADLARIALSTGDHDGACEHLLRADHRARALERVDHLPRLRSLLRQLPQRLREVATGHIGPAE
jgi:hypothetical protein